MEIKRASMQRKRGRGEKKWREKKDEGFPLSVARLEVCNWKKTHTFNARLGCNSALHKSMEVSHSRCLLVDGLLVLLDRWRTGGRTLLFFSFLFYAAGRLLYFFFLSFFNALLLILLLLVSVLFSLMLLLSWEWIRTN